MSTEATTQVKRGRNWLLTIICIPLTALFIYIAVGVWFVNLSDEYSASQEIYGKFILSALSAYATFIFGRMVVRGHTKRGFKRTLEDVVTSGL
jgi:hypothetical protein